MSLLRRLELLETHHPSLFLAESLTLSPLIDDPRDDFFFRGLDIVDAVADLVQVETLSVPFHGSGYRRVYHQRTTVSDIPANRNFLNLLDRVSSLEHRLERALGERAKERERKYKWTGEIEGKRARRQEVRVGGRVQAREGEERRGELQVGDGGQGEGRGRGEDLHLDGELRRR